MCATTAAGLPPTDHFGLNILLIPRLGVAGAAWASVGTFAVFSFVGLWRYRRFDKYPYPFARCAGVVFGLIATFVALRALDRTAMPVPAVHILAGLAWLSWALLLFGPLIRGWLGRRVATAPGG